MSITLSLSLFNFLGAGGTVAVSPVESRPLKPRFWKVEKFPGVICEVRDLDLDLFLLLSESALTTRLTNN